jgi:transcription antitermination protein NusB
MPARTKARKRALDILYEADLMGLDPTTTLRLRLAQADPPVPPYSVDLVEGVVAHRSELDRLISTLAEGWTLGRMPAVDRNVLRLGAFELLYRSDVPEGVAVSEAVELVGRLSTDESATFVNGVLAKVAERRPAAGSDGLDSAPRVG